MIEVGKSPVPAIRTHERPSVKKKLQLVLTSQIVAQVETEETDEILPSVANLLFIADGGL